MSGTITFMIIPTGGFTPKPSPRQQEELVSTSRQEKYATCTIHNKIWLQTKSSVVWNCYHAQNLIPISASFNTQQDLYLERVLFSFFPRFM